MTAVHLTSMSIVTAPFSAIPSENGPSDIAEFGDLFKAQTQNLAGELPKKIGMPGDVGVKEGLDSLIKHLIVDKNLPKSVEASIAGKVADNKILARNTNVEMNEGLDSLINHLVVDKNLPKTVEASVPGKVADNKITPRHTNVNIPFELGSVQIDANTPPVPDSAVKSGEEALAAPHQVDLHFSSPAGRQSKMLQSKQIFGDAFPTKGNTKNDGLESNLRATPDTNTTNAVLTSLMPIALPAIAKSDVQHVFDTARSATELGKTIQKHSLLQDKGAIEYNALENRIEVRLPQTSAETSLTAPTSSGFTSALQVVSQNGQAVAADKYLDLAQGDLWLDDLAQDIVSMSNTQDKINFRLLPQHLGRMDVNMTTSSAGLTVNIQTETEAARTLLVAGQPRMIDEIRSHGIRVVETQITSGGFDHQSSHTPRHAQPAREPEHAINDEPIELSPVHGRTDGRFA
jgi:flagellar hook-length control protein FliK